MRWRQSTGNREHANQTRTSGLPKVTERHPAKRGRHRRIFSVEKRPRRRKSPTAIDLRTQRRHGGFGDEGSFRLSA